MKRYAQLLSVPFLHTGVLCQTVVVLRNFFLYLFIRDFLRKRTSKDQYPSRRAFMPFGRWFYKTEQLTQPETISRNFSILLLIRDFI